MYDLLKLMLTSKEGGFVRIVLILIVLVGIGATSYLVLKPAIFAPKANESEIIADNIPFFSNDLESTSSADVIEASLPAISQASATPVPITTPTSKPTPTPSPKLTATSTPTPTPTPVPTQIPTATLPRLIVNPSSAVVNKGCNFSLNIQVDTAGIQTDGVDASLIFDPSRFSAYSINPGLLYRDNPTPVIDNQSGMVAVSSIAAPGSLFIGQGTVAKVNFTVKPNAPEGITQIKFDFDPTNKSKTIDSNIVKNEVNTEILDSVIDGNYTIGTGPC